MNNDDKTALGTLVIIAIAFAFPMMQDRLENAFRIWSYRRKQKRIKAAMKRIFGK